MDKGHTPNIARGEGLIATRTNTAKHTHGGTGKVTRVTNVHLHPMVRTKAHNGESYHTFRNGDDRVPMWCEQGKPKEIYVGRIETDKARIQYFVHMNPRHESFYLWGYDECPICGQSLYESHWMTFNAIEKQTPLEVLQ